MNQDEPFSPEVASVRSLATGMRSTSFQISQLNYVDKGGKEHPIFGLLVKPLEVIPTRKASERS